jgi:hypothetical protein
MKVVMPVAIPELLRFRARTGSDRFDEMWEGVLHMTPSPSVQHQWHASRILNFLVEVWCPRTGGGAVMQMNVSTPERWEQDYRIPDISVMRPDRLPQGEVMFVRPNVVFEIRSPGDETYENRDRLFGHVLMAMRGYLTRIGEWVGRPVTDVDASQDPYAIVARAPEFADEVLAAYRRHLAQVTTEELEKQAHRTRWGDLMSVEMLLEHAVVHPMRHRIQLERILEGKATVKA